MKLQLIKFLKYLLSFLEDYLLIPEDRPLTGEILKLMNNVDDNMASGEWKNRYVTAKMQKLHPELRASDIKLEIELLYQQYFK